MRNIHPAPTRRLIGIAAALAAPAVLFRAGAARAQGRTALDVINGAASVSLFAELIRDHGLESDFTQPGNAGFFIPVNHAIEILPALFIERSRRDADFVRRSILNHITDYTQPLSGWAGRDMINVVRVTTRIGNRYTLNETAGRIPTIGGAPIIGMNFRASNGLLHGIDGILRA